MTSLVLDFLASASSKRIYTLHGAFIQNMAALDNKITFSVNGLRITQLGNCLNRCRVEYPCDDTSKAVTS